MKSVNQARAYPKFWLSYFVLSALAVAINLITAAFDPENTKASHLIGIAISLVGLIPLYGFVRQRRYNPRWLWQLVLAIATFGTLVAIGICVIAVFTHSALTPALLAVAIATTCAPYLFALHQYVFRSPVLWQ